MDKHNKIADMFDETKWGAQFCREEIELISYHMSIRTYAPEEAIFVEGEIETYMAFIVEGQVDIYKHSADSSEKLVISLTARSHFGELAFIDKAPRSASATAKSEVTLLVLSHEAFEEIICVHPYLAIKMLINIAWMISQRLRETTGKYVYLRS